MSPHEAFFSQAPTSESNNHREQRLEKIILTFIRKHVHDVIPHGAGRGEALHQVSGALFGCKDVTVDRCHPKLLIDTIRLERGKSFVLIGPNGGGKSTAFDAIMEVGQAEFNTNNDRGAYAYGSSVHGRPALRFARLDQEELLANLDGFSANEVLEAIVHRVKKELPVDWEDLDAYDTSLANQIAHQEIDELRSRLQQLFHMEEFLDRDVSQLSGGERTKLSLCAVFLNKPDVLLLDEPTNHLDLESIAKLGEIIRLYTKAGSSVLSVSHVDAFLREAGTGGVIEIQSSPETRRAISSSASYTGYIHNRAREGGATIVDGDIQWRAQNPKASGALVMSREEAVTIPNSPLVNVNVPSLLPRAVWVLCGNNGTGKTKLLHELAGETHSHLFTSPKGTAIAYLPQFWPDDVAQGSVENFFSYIKERLDRFDATANPARFQDAIKAIGFQSAQQKNNTRGSSLLQRKLSTLSGGEQRLLWFVAVSCFPHVDALLLDEPTNHLDLKLQSVMTEAIRSFPGAVIVSTHDLNLLDALSEDVGNKGPTLAPTNVVLVKKNGATSISISPQNPAEYMRAYLASARRHAQTRLQGRL